MIKYINLIIKDLIVYKKFMIFLFYFQVVSIFSPSSLVISFVLPTIISTSTFLLLLKIEEEKSKGTEFLITTSYTRKDIVIAKYLLTLFIILIQSILYCFISFFRPTGFKFNLFSFLLCILFIILFISIFIPLLFCFKVRTISLLSPLLAIITVPITLLNSSRPYNYFTSSYRYFYFFIFCFISLILFIASIIISQKCYSKKDL